MMLLTALLQRQAPAPLRTAPVAAGPPSPQPNCKLQIVNNINVSFFLNDILNNKKTNTRTMGNKLVVVVSIQRGPPPPGPTMTPALGAAMMRGRAAAGAQPPRAAGPGPVPGGARARRGGPCAAGQGIELITSDVDGTLLNSRQQLTPRVQQAVQLALKAGVPVRTDRVPGSESHERSRSQPSVRAQAPRLAQPAVLMLFFFSFFPPQGRPRTVAGHGKCSLVWDHQKQAFSFRCS